MMLVKVDIFHNITTTAEAAEAGDEDCQLLSVSVLRTGPVPRRSPA